MAQPPLALIYRNNQKIQVQLFGNLIYVEPGIELNMDPGPPAVPWPESATVRLISLTLAEINVDFPIPPGDGPQLYAYFIVYRQLTDPLTMVRRSRPVSMLDLEVDPTGVEKHDPDVGNQNQP